MVEGIESVVVGEGDVSRMVQQQCEDVVALLGHSVMQGSVPFMVLHRRKKRPLRIVSNKEEARVNSSLRDLSNIPLIM